ncbi:MAG: cytidyltransferase [Candidatus Peribacteria bacterium]|nr:cytidyltransferase [Candidatus Peribacteria bacterium]
MLYLLCMNVLVFGTFDHLHPGHLFLLNEAAKRGDLYVVVARDANVERFKGKKSDQPEDERVAAIQSKFPSATVLLGDADDFLAPVRSVKPDLILLGYDQKLPPGVSEENLMVPVERLPAFKPDVHKSSLRRRVSGNA